MPTIENNASSIKSRAARLVQKVRDYTKAPDLKKCHHFLFNLPAAGCVNVEEVKYIIIGQNPGMGRFDKEDIEQYPDRTCREETSDNDYRQSDYNAGRRIGKYTVISRKENKWQRTIRDILPNGGFVQTERFFWSSSSLKNIEELYGSPLNKSPHLKFCADMNNELVKLYNPEIVLCPGFYGSKKMIEMHDLEFVHKIKRKGGRLIEERRDKENRPWLFMPNPTGARGFSGGPGKSPSETDPDSDFETIKRYVAKIALKGPSA